LLVDVDGSATGSFSYSRVGAMLIRIVVIAVQAAFDDVDGGDVLR
jgi:hypothetical protein